MNYYLLYTGHTKVPVWHWSWGCNAELQDTVLFLSSDASSYITGINIPIDGGYTIY